MLELQLQLHLENERQTLEFAARLAYALEAQCTLYLYGDLGAGKTCLSRGIIQALGFDGRVKSPTFTIVEPYELSDQRHIFHFDFYRLSDPQEAAYLGLDHYFEQAFLCLIEWPDKAIGFIPDADIEIYLSYEGAARNVKLVAKTEKGHAILNKLIVEV